MEASPRTAAWSAWAGWAAVPRDLLERHRVRLTVHELADAELDLRRDWARLPPQVALYTPKQIRHLIRLENALGRGPTSAPDRWPLRRADSEAYWRVHDFLQNVHLERPPLPAPAPALAGRAGGAAGPRGGWESAAWGWAAGAMLLAVLVLLVRALERFLHRKLFKGRRRSEEWPTPNVLATSHRYGSDLEPPPRLDDSETFPSDVREASGNDLPPPYSECAGDVPPEAIDPNKPIDMEEPPPPYSACYFANPKDGIPTVHFSRRSVENSEVGQTSADPNVSSVSTVRSEGSNKISDVGCEVNASLDSNVSRYEATVSAIGATSEDRRADSAHGEDKRLDCPDHVVDIVDSSASQGRVVTV